MGRDQQPACSRNFERYAFVGRRAGTGGRGGAAYNKFIYPGKCLQFPLLIAKEAQKRVRVETVGPCTGE